MSLLVTGTTLSIFDVYSRDPVHMLVRTRLYYVHAGVRACVPVCMLACVYACV